MASSDYAEAFAELLGSLVKIRDDRGRTSASFNATKTSFEEIPTQSSSQTSHTTALKLLTEHTAEACKSKAIYGDTLLSVLADATRSNPLWRSLLGVQESSNIAVAPVCVLDVARDIIADTANSSTESQTSRMKDALRLIANCCADENQNRKRFLEQDGMRSLVQLMMLNIEVDTLIPTIYNICNGYEDPEHEEVVELSDHSDPNENGDVTKNVSFASMKLAAACAGRTDFTTYELILSSASNCSSDRREYLAELVEMAIQPVIVDTAEVFGTFDSLDCAWTFTRENQQVDMLQAVTDLADNSIECRVHMLKSILLLLSNKGTRESFLRRTDDSIWRVVQLACFQPASDEDEPDDYEEELAECRKHFLKMFYELTGSAEIAENLAQNSAVVKHCFETLSPNQPNGGAESNTSTPLKASLYLRICALVILSQACASTHFRDQLSNNAAVLETISMILRIEREADILYPAVAIIARIASSETDLDISVLEAILYSMKRFLTDGGLGLIIPYETVNAYRLLLRNKPQRLPLYLQDNGHGSIMSSLVTLFDRTIEAGTKLEVGQYFIDVLRTIFPLAKDMDESNVRSDDTILTPFFEKLLTEFGVKIGEILAFICTKAEPKENRVHGWFGLGMFSVWRSGRLAIIDSMIHHDLSDAMIAASLVPSGPVPQNLKLVLSKMQLCSEDDVPEVARENLRTAAHNLGLTINLR